MRKLLLSSVAAAALSAAVLPAKAADLAPYRAPAPYWSWTGFYFGGHLGSGWAFKQWDDPTGVFAAFGITPFTGKSDFGGAIGGFQVGFNYQVGSLVWGLEADASLADIEGDTRCALALALCNTHITALGTITGRLGYTWDYLLLYVKGGAAWAREDLRLNSFFFADDFQATDTRWGWTIGAGLEYAFTSGFSAKVEYNYLGFVTER